MHSIVGESMAWSHGHCLIEVLGRAAQSPQSRAGLRRPCFASSLMYGTRSIVQALSVDRCTLNAPPPGPGGGGAPPTQAQRKVRERERNLS